jgi:hypothetical protein
MLCGSQVNPDQRAMSPLWTTRGPDGVVYQSVLEMHACSAAVSMLRQRRRLAAPGRG